MRDSEIVIGSQEKFAGQFRTSISTEVSRLVQTDANFIVEMRISRFWIPLTSGILKSGTAERRDLTAPLVHPEGVPVRRSCFVAEAENLYPPSLMAGLQKADPAVKICGNLPLLDSAYERDSEKRNRRKAGPDCSTGAPGGSRTPNPQIRSLMLYPIELRVQRKEEMGRWNEDVNPLSR